MLKILVCDDDIRILKQVEGLISVERHAKRNYSVSRKNL